MGGTVSRKKRGEETEILKKGDKLGQRRDTLKMGGGRLEPSYKLWKGHTYLNTLNTYLNTLLVAYLFKYV